MCPRPWRFAAAVLVARMLQPVIRHSRAYAHRKTMRTDHLRETTLDLVMLMLGRHRVPFDPAVHVTNPHLLEPDERPVLLVSPHTSLSLFILRHLHDRRIPHIVVSLGPLQVAGTGLEAPILPPTPSLFVRLRSEFVPGRIVAGMIDRAESERHTVTLRTAEHEFYVDTALLQFGRRANARVVILAAHLDANWNVTLDLHQPRQETLEDILSEVEEFFPKFMRLG